MNKIIVANKRILNGTPIIKGTRIPVFAVLQQFKNGDGKGHVKEVYPQLSQRQIDAVVDYYASK